MLVLTVIKGPDTGRRFELPANEPQLVGRSSEALPLTDTTVSRRHAELTPDKGSWHIRDLNSRNGTLVNGVSLSERVRLHPGDQIRVGATVFVFGRTGPPEPGDDLIRLVSHETSVERTLPAGDDSVLLESPAPTSAAIRRLEVIYELTALTTDLSGRDELLRGVMDLVFRHFEPERGFILLAEDGKLTHARPEVVKYAPGQRAKGTRRFRVSRTILRSVLERGEGVLSSDAMTDPRFAAGDSVQSVGIRSAVCSPIVYHQRVLGAIYADSSTASASFTAEQLALLNAIGRHTGLALATDEAHAERLHTERLAAIGETVASLSHSIKNILQGLRGGADVVEMGLKREDLDVARNGWGILQRNLDRIMALSLNMLAYSRRHAPEPVSVAPAELIEDAAELAQDLAASRGVAVMLDLDADLPAVALDPGLCHQALVNLMVNAVEAAPPREGAVTVKASFDDDSTPPALEVRVIDNGPGIPVSQGDRVFDPFFTTKGLRGTGLGLAVTKRIVSEHRGTIQVESPEGEGATFIVRLPADLHAKDPSETT